MNIDNIGFVGHLSACSRQLDASASADIRKAEQDAVCVSVELKRGASGRSVTIGAPECTHLRIAYLCFTADGRRDGEADTVGGIVWEDFE